MNSFMLDMKYSRMYEKWLSDRLGYKHNITTKDDQGIDLISPDGKILIDVKAFIKPTYLKHFTGVFIETYQYKSNKPGWFTDETKLTTHYALFQDCSRERMSFYRCFLITRENLHKAAKECYDNKTIQFKKYQDTDGIIIPYKLLEKYSTEIIEGDTYEN